MLCSVKLVNLYHNSQRWVLRTGDLCNNDWFKSRSKLLTSNLHKKGPTLEVWVVFPPPMLKSDVRDVKELLERESRERERRIYDRVTVLCPEKRTFHPEIKDYLYCLK